MLRVGGNRPTGAVRRLGATAPGRTRPTLLSRREAGPVRRRRDGPRPVSGRVTPIPLLRLLRPTAILRPAPVLHPTLLRTGLLLTGLLLPSMLRTGLLTRMLLTGMLLTGLLRHPGRPGGPHPRRPGLWPGRLASVALRLGATFGA